MYNQEWNKRKQMREIGTIENKVGAGFQPMQAQRYRERGENYKKRYKISDYRTVLVAPTSYFSGDFKGFDARINYEDIFEWFASNRSMGNRKQYKLSLLHSAIEKSTFGYQTVADAVVTLRSTKIPRFARNFRYTQTVTLKTRI